MIIKLTEKQNIKKQLMDFTTGTDKMILQMVRGYNFKLMKLMKIG
jgi:hypothetical protein